MSHLRVLFLIFFVPILAIFLAWLGFQTVSTNVVGWFLILVGLLFSLGTLIAFFIQGKNLWKNTEKKKPQVQEPDDRSFWIITLGMTFAFFLPPIEYLYFPFSFFPTSIMAILGLVLILVGSFIFGYARHVLRKWYSGHLSDQENQVLIQNGPYRLVRHPAYLGYLLMAVGISLGYVSLIGMVNLVLLLIIFRFRMKVEERLLVDYFGEAYLLYAKKTKRILPFIW